jgi:hypothetical protein
MRQKPFIKPDKIVNAALRFYNPRHLAAKLGSLFWPFTPFSMPRFSSFVVRKINFTHCKICNDHYFSHLSIEEIESISKGLARISILVVVYYITTNIQFGSFIFCSHYMSTEWQWKKIDKECHPKSATRYSHLEPLFTAQCSHLTDLK